ncbi:MAG: carbonic anhydrase [Gammaproteobacteria bacterium]|nr:carbonic anhydrase [Gammaproteobacteria bacterium]
MMKNNNSNIKLFIDGFKKFQKKHDNILEDTAYTQQPKAMMITCCDSRIDPSLITDTKPGELFVIRNVANLVPPFEGDLRHHGTSAAIEYGVLYLGVTDIIVLGHSNCGGIASLFSNQNKIKSSDFINNWIDIARDAKDRTLDRCKHNSQAEQINCCEKESLLISLQNLQTFPWIKDKIDKKEIYIHAWYLDLASGTIEAYNSDLKEFIPL